MRVAVALALILTPDRSRVIIGKRPAKAHMGGLWEFPGGKIEPGELPSSAAVREAREETGLDVAIDERWPTIEHRYPDRIVTLHPWLCRMAPGDRLGMGSPWKLVKLGELGQYEFPAANAALLARLDSIKD